MRLSVVVITLNEETNLQRCLESIAFADEVIVVDSGSEDRTCDIAREFTDKVFEHSMQGFGEQKQFAVEQASGDWILSLDADEWLSDEARRSIKNILSNRVNACDAYRLYRLNYFYGRPIRHCGWYAPILRLFRRGEGRFNDKLVHEEVVVEGSIGILEGDILHVPYRDVFHHLEKMQRYARLDARELLKKGRAFHGILPFAHIVLRPMWKFVEKYIFQQGFREGMHGFVLSVLAAFGVFLMHVHAWNIYREDASK